MTCTSCGMELPAGAMFCGECGRGVAARASSAAVARCEQCDAAIGANDIFCGECGFVVRSALTLPGPRDTVVLDRDELLADFARFDEIAAEGAGRVSIEDVVAAERSGLSARPSAEPAVPAIADPILASPPPVRSPPPPAAQAKPHAPGPVPPLVQPSPKPAPSPAVPVASRGVAPAFDDIDEIERTRIVQRTQRGERFILQFSTGESVTVFGTGLLGRNPAQQPGEYFDHLVALTDPGKSVSKTHLEFGQAAGAFWINDRFSANGTTVREPDSASRRCDPGKRYRIVRGTRVDIGEQFFIVS